MADRDNYKNTKPKTVPKLETESQNLKQNHKTQNRITNSKQNHITQTGKTKLNTEPQNPNRVTKQESGKIP